MFFDSHAHYCDDRYDREYPGGVEALLAEAFAGDVAGVVNVGSSVENSILAVKMAAKYPKMYATVGIHPGDAQDYGSDSAPHIAKLDSLLFDAAKNKIVALGEIGLDYHYPDTDRELQMHYFKEQMKLAERHRVPVVVHDREAHGDCLKVVSEFPNVKGVFHSFSGSRETAFELLSMGWYVSFSGTVTFTNARKVAEAATAMPHDRVLIETDCPYLAPHPHRGTLNHSMNLRYIVAKLAELWGIPADDVARITRENAIRFFGINNLK